jgi:hypothetical protein
MGQGYVDLSKYFSRTVNRPDVRIMLHPGTGDIIKEQRASNRFNFWSRADDFEPGQFYGKRFARHYGLDPTAFANAPIERVQQQIQQQYGMGLGEYLQASPGQRQQQYNAANKTYKSDGSMRGDPGPLIDPDTGLPNRPPQTPEEAMMMQWKAFESTREQNLGLMKNALATLRYGLGGVTRGGPFSSYAMQSPLLGQMANTYMNTQFEAPDLSYFLRDDVPGYNQGQQAPTFGFGQGQIPLVSGINYRGPNPLAPQPTQPIGTIGPAGF